MKAWEIRKGALGLHEVVSVHPSEDETMVRVSHSGICGSDLPKLVRPHGFALPEPWRPGHEIVGTDPSGHAVAVDPLVPCGTCDRCVAGDSHLCPDLRRLGWDLPGGFAERVVVPATNTHPLPNYLDPLLAVLTDPAAVAIHGLRCTPIAPPGQLVVVGAGTIGLLTAIYAHQQGWEVTVVHSDRRAPHRNIVDAVPAAFHPLFTPTAENAFDVVVDAASGADSTPSQLALRLVRDGGTVVVQNAYHPNVFLAKPLRDLFSRSIRLIGSFSHCRRKPGDFDLGLGLLGQYAASVAQLVTRTIGLTDLKAVLASRTILVGRHALIVNDI